MEIVEKTTQLYVAADGTEFLDMKSCEEYERVSGNIHYFIVMHSPDLNETGLFTKTSVAAVYADERYGHHYSILMNWCVREKKYPILCQSVQGYGWQCGFEITDNRTGWPETAWKRFKAGGKVSEHQSWTFPTFGEKVFLSPIEVDGFPKPFNYVKEWSLNM